MSNHETIQSEGAASSVSLETYATVLAGLGAGLALSRALMIAEVRPDEWELAAEYWPARIDESAASDLVLLVAFDAALIAARRRFEPSIEPIESDARAWSHFRRHFVTAVDPIAFLGERGVSLATYARIEADWTNRLLMDQALAASVQDYLKAPLEECPTLTKKASPLLSGKASAAATEASHVRAEPHEGPRAATPRPQAMPSGSQPAPPRSPSEPVRAPLAAVAIKRAPPALAGTSMHIELPKGPALPFAPGTGQAPSGSPSNTRAAPPDVLPAVKRAPAEVTGTLLGSLAPKGPALPFTAGAAAQSDPVAGPPAAPSPTGLPVKRAPAALTGTVMESLAPQGAATPFLPSDAPNARDAPPSPAVKLPSVNRAPAALTGTSVASVAPKGPAMPFVSNAVTPTTTPSVKLPPVNRPPAALSGTSLGLVAPKGPALPFASSGDADTSASVETSVQSVPSSERPTLRNAALPSVTSEGSGTLDTTTPPPTAAPVPFPRAESAPPVALSLEQYASLCVELAMDPSKSEAILVRYQLTTEQKKVLDAHWQRRFAAEASVWMAFDRAYAAYKAWLVSSRDK